MRGTKSSQTAGPDGWTWKGLQALPPVFLDRLADIFQKIENTGKWPSPLLEAVVTLIPKGEGSSPLKQRPITVTSVVYRLWSRCRLFDAMEWQEEWADESQYGFRRKRGPIDAHVEWMLHVEEAHATKGRVAGILLDCEKCFDKIPHEIVLSLCEAIGMHANVLRPLQGVMAGLHKRFQLAGGGVGSRWKSTNGIVQWCPLSVMLVNIPIMVWMKVIRAEAEGAKPRAFADDKGALFRDLPPGELRDAIAKVLELTHEFVQLAGQAINPGKSQLFGFPAEVADNLQGLTRGGQQLSVVERTRDLGGPLTVSKWARNKTFRDRLVRAKEVIPLIAALPLPTTQERENAHYWDGFYPQSDVRL